MIADLKPYPAMKHSGVEWLGEVPEHWEVRRLKTLFSAVDIRSESGSEELLTVSSNLGIVLRRSANVTMFKAESYAGHKLCWPGDLVINSLWAWSRGLGVSDHHGIVSTAYGVYRPRDAGMLDPRFVHALVRSTPFRWELRVRSKGVWTSRLQLTDESFFGAPFPLPPLAEQAAIVRFLDYADRRIRRYIRAKQKLIKLLEEQKLGIIHRAVTRGLDPDVPLRDSGVEWLGEVPEHWEVMRVKQASQVLRGKFTHRPRNDPSLYDGPYPFIQTGEVARSDKTITSYRQTLNERGLAVSRMSPAGTLVMTIAAKIGDVAVLDFDACFPDSVVGFAPRKHVERDFLYYMFRAMKPELLREAPVNTQGNLNVDRIGSRGIGVPPIPEQQGIVRRIEAETGRLDEAIDRGRREISLLRELRTRLIADVVTGKVDVREAAARLPDEESDLAALDDADALTDADALIDAEDATADDLDAVLEEVEA